MKIKEKTMIYLKSPRKLIRSLGAHNFFNWLPDKQYLKLVYLGETGKKLNINNPTTYTEKLQWIKLYDRKPVYSKYVDKYAVRSYISEIIGEQYLIPLIGLYNRVEDINWDSLPGRFVIKCTHGSGSNIICLDKGKFDIEKSKVDLSAWMKKNWYWFGREWPYKNVKPRIICEEFISNNGEPPMDYKVLCFNGKAKLIEVHIDRFDKHKQDFYNIKWEKMQISQGTPTSNVILERPNVLEEMIQLSETLAQNIYHVRIDWYVIQKKLLFGEITFFDASGFCPFDSEKDEQEIGQWINLNER
jgi:hypothetical protein